MQKKSTSKVLAFFLTVALLLGIASPISVLALSSEPQNSIQVDPEVMQEMETKGFANYWIDFDAKADLSAANSMDWSERGWYVYETLSKIANASQARVAAYLTDSKVEYQAYWIKNTILVKSSNLTTLNGLLGFSEIKVISPRQTYILYEPNRSAAVMDNGFNSIEPNLTHINADDVWAMDIDGSGLVVASIDTGVRYTHQALVKQYRGNNGDGAFDHDYNWFDPYGNYVVPTDANGHGTHTMGTMVGDDGGSNQIGIAPGAEWMACRGCSTSQCTDAALLACGEFIAAPTTVSGTDPDPDMRPNAVNNSWGDCGQTYDDWYADVISAWHAGGIYPIFSNGNASNCGYSSPPGLNTVGNPARSGDVTGVGSSGEQNGQYATHSNWGPTDDPDKVNPTEGFDMMKPQVLAPGVSIRSSVPTSDTSYVDGWSGTSMSAPHVTGLVALVWQAAPCLVGDYAATENIIEETAVNITYNDGSPDTPSDFPNYATGWGEIDALAAVQAATSYCGTSTIEGTVTDKATSEPIVGAKIEIIAEGDPANNRTVYTNDEGYYSASVNAGTFIIGATKYGYISVAETDIVVVDGETITVDFALEKAPISLVSGYVYDAGIDESNIHGYWLYAKINVTSTGFNQTIYSDPITGYYEIELALYTEFTFTTTSVVHGYNSVVEQVTPVLEVFSHDILMMVDAIACAAPGYQPDYDFFWSFEQSDGGFTPGGTTSFAWGDFTSGPMEGHSGTKGIVTNPGGNYNASELGWMVSPEIDLSGYGTDTPAIQWWDWKDIESVSWDWARVDVTKDGGTTWTKVWGPVGGVHDTQYNQQTVVLDPTYNVSNFQFRFYFKSDGSVQYAGWYVDDIGITTASFVSPPCVVIPGGAVAGYVTDEMTSEPLIGADVYSETAATVSFVLEDDPDNAGVYWLFQPTEIDPQPVLFTASKDLYADETATVSVRQNAVTQQDFALVVELWKLYLPIIAK